MIEIAVSTILCVSTLISTYIMGKKMLKNAISEVEDLIFSLPQNEEGAKVLFSMGALFASGVKSGLGMQKGRGKFSVMGLIQEIAGAYLQKQLPQMQGEQPQTIKPLQERL